MNLSLKQSNPANIFSNTEPETKCSEQGFEHDLVENTPNIVYTSYPPSSPDKQETCKNCGITRYHRQKIEKWIEYKL